MLILQWRLSGIEMKDLGIFSRVMKTKLYIAQKRKDAAKN